MKINKLYKIYIYEIYKDLIKSNKKEYDNNDLWKIFEYFTVIMLNNSLKDTFYLYEDIDPDFKEQHNMTG